MKYSPIGILTLNRNEHFKRCLESLEHCTGAENTEVYIALDYPPAEKYIEGWKKNDAYLKVKEQSNRFKKLVVFRREQNYGTKGDNSNGSILHKYLMEHFDFYIMSEDDNEFSPNYLEYMNQCFGKYADDPDIIAITGYSYPINWRVSKYATVLKQNFNASAWGWGWWTAKRKELIKYLFEGNLLRNINKTINNHTYEAMIDAAKREYFQTACLYRGYKDPEVDLWKRVCDFSCRCYLAVENKYFISPIISKVRNLGFDGSGIYCQMISNVNGNTAGTYNYAQQSIDKAPSFEIVEDTLNDYLYNRNQLNTFDYRSPKEMKRTNTLIWLCEHIGCWSAKFYARLLQPFEMTFLYLKLKLK